MYRATVKLLLRSGDINYTKCTVILTIGVLFTVVAECFVLWNRNVPPDRWNLEIALMLVVSSAFLGAVAYVLAFVLGGRLRWFWFNAFAWAFLVAGSLNVVGKGYTEFVLRPELEHQLQNLFPDESEHVAGSNYVGRKSTIRGVATATYSGVRRSAQCLPTRAEVNLDSYRNPDKAR